MSDLPDPSPPQDALPEIQSTNKTPPPPPSVAGFIPVNTHIDRVALEKLVVAHQARVGTDAFIAGASEPGSFENVILSLLETTGTGELRRTLDAMEALTDEQRASLSHQYKSAAGNISQIGIKQKFTAGDKPESLSGTKGAQIMLSARKHKVRMIPLYNSGINLSLKAPSIDNLNNFILSAQLASEEYGRLMGAYYYYYMDIILKQNFMSMLEGLIVDSNVKNWQQRNKLASLIKLPDFNVIMASVAAMMYPTGYPNFRHACMRPKDDVKPNGCGHSESVTLDITKMIRTNFLQLGQSNKAISHMVKCLNTAVSIDQTEINEYQAELGFDGTSIVFDSYQFVLRSPSMAHYFECGEMFNRDILNQVQADNVQGVYDIIAGRELRIFLPWIQKIVSLDEEGRPVHETEDYMETIPLLLDEMMSVEGYQDGLQRKLAEFVNSVQLTHVCYPTYACPSCGYEPPTKTGFFTVDAQYTFFTLARKKREGLLTPALAS